MTYFGISLESMLEKAGHKPSKEERKAEAARKALLDKVFDDGSETKKGSGYADPAMMF